MPLWLMPDKEPWSLGSELRMMKLEMVLLSEMALKSRFSPSAPSSCLGLRTAPQVPVTIIAVHRHVAAAGLGLHCACSDCVKSWRPCCSPRWCTCVDLQMNGIVVYLQSAFVVEGLLAGATEHAALLQGSTPLSHRTLFSGDMCVISEVMEEVQGVDGEEFPLTLNSSDSILETQHPAASLLLTGPALNRVPSRLTSGVSCLVCVSWWLESLPELSNGAGTEFSSCSGSMRAILLTSVSKWCPLLQPGASALAGRCTGRCVLLSMKLRMSELVLVVGTMTACPSLSCSAMSSTMDFGLSKAQETAAA